MYETLLRMWKNGDLNEQDIDKAVSYNWITKEKGEFIKAQPQKKH